MTIKTSVLHTAIYHSLMEHVAIIDSQGQILDVNQAWIAFGINNGIDEDFDWTTVNYLEALYQSSQTGDELAFEAYKGIKSVIQGQADSYYQEYPCHSPTEQRWFFMLVTALTIKKKQYWVLSHHNITQHKLTEMRSEYQANHDQLTGLSNRRQFHQQLEISLRQNDQLHTGLCLMLCDLDNFKQFNDAHGHQAGDLCLVRIAATLQQSLSVPSTSYRLGGDEFALLLTQVSLLQTQEIAASLNQRIRELKLLCGNQLQVTSSIGGVFVPCNTPISSQLLIDETDQILYQVKRHNKNSYMISTFDHQVQNNNKHGKSNH